MGKLYTFPHNPRAFRILIAAQYSGATVEVIDQAPAFKLGETNQSAEFLAKFPFGKVPAFVTDDGAALYETNAIAQYVASANNTLSTASAYEAALVQQYISIADHEIYPASCTWVYPTFGIIQFNKAATAKAQDDIKRVLQVLNGVLETKTFLVGERVTLADISVATALLQLYQQVLDPAFREAFPHVNRWFLTAVNQPQFKTVLGEVKLAEKQAQFDAEAFANFQKQTGKKEAKKEEPKKEAKKEEPKKKAKDEDEEEEEDEFAEKPTKDPLGHLPPSTFNLDAFKRSYSNEDTPKAIEHFWANFDPQGFSIWKCSYKYPEELRLVFMSCNLITGMLQRLDKLRKYAFSSMAVFGEDNNNQIAGIWVWKGQDLVFPLSEDWQVDFASYEWTKLEPAQPETKALVNEYLLWEGEFKDVGKKFNQGKIFK
jgi:elongation factor 1-gamma